MQKSPTYVYIAQNSRSRDCVSDFWGKWWNAPPVMLWLEKIFWHSLGNGLNEITVEKSGVEKSRVKMS